MDNLTLPKELTPINLKAYFYNALNMCGCWEFGPVHYNILFLLKYSPEEIDSAEGKAYDGCEYTK